MKNAAALRASLPLLVGLIFVAVFVGLGNWQSRRAHDKLALQAEIDALADARAQPLRADADAAQLQSWQKLSVRGTWQDADTMLLDNRTHEGRAGFHVLTPLRLDDGSGLVLVNRGWVAAPSDRAQLPATPAPAGIVQLEGRLQHPEVAPFTLSGSSNRAVGKLWQVLDLTAYAQAHAFAGCAATAAASCLANWVMLQTSPAPDGLVRAWTPPSAGIDRHRGYALQWYALATLTSILVAWYVRHLWARRTHEARKPRLAGH